MLEVNASTGAAQHSLDQIGDLVAGQDQRRQLGASPPSDEDPTRLVDPDLLDLGVVEQRLQWTEPGHRVDHSTTDLRRIAQRRQRRGHRAIAIVADDLVHEQANRAALGDRVDAAAPDEFADLVLDDRLRGRQSRSPRQQPPGAVNRQKVPVTLTDCNQSATACG